METNSVMKLMLVLASVVAAAGVISGCGAQAGTTAPNATPDPATPEELQQAYRAAVADAAIAEPDEVCTELIAIVDGNAQLVWREQEGIAQVLVVTWTSWDGYDSQVGQTLETTRDTWVTAVPEVQNFCQANPAPAQRLTLRLEQLLGLPPDDGKTRFVEFWVSPDDLFRPSADPEITDHEAGPDYPAPSDLVTIAAAHVQWMESQSAASYGDNSYPWTRLGYTYDWGNPAGEVGLSEFVIRTGATVTVESVALNEVYCPAGE